MSDTAASPPKKRLRFTLDLAAHDHEDIADALRDIAFDVATSTTKRSVSSRGWRWETEQQSDLTREEYRRALDEWFNNKP